MGRLTRAWAVDRPKTRGEKKAEYKRKQELTRLIQIQASEMKNENLCRMCGD